MSVIQTYLREGECNLLKNQMSIWKGAHFGNEIEWFLLVLYLDSNVCRKKNLDSNGYKW